jgi:hypothetical protein
MRFEFLDNGVTREAVVHLSSRRMGDSTDDLTLQVGTILATAIQAETGYTLVTADMHTETATRVFPPLP